MGTRLDGIDKKYYATLFESLQTYAEDDVSDEEIMDDILAVLEDEVLSAEPVVRVENGEYHVTRLSVINTVINALLPGHRLVVEVDEDTEEMTDVYLIEV